MSSQKTPPAQNNVITHSLNKSIANDGKGAKKSISGAFSSVKTLVSRNLALKLSNDIKDSAQLSSIQLFEDQRTTTPPSSSSGTNNSQSSNEFVTSRVTSATKSLSTSANSKSLSSLLFINTTGNFSYDGSNATTPTSGDLLAASCDHRAQIRSSRHKLARSESIAAAENDDLDDIGTHNLSLSSPDPNYSGQIVAANIKQAVGRADQLTNDLNLCRNEPQTPTSSSPLAPKTPVSPDSPVSPQFQDKVFTAPNTAVSSASSFQTAPGSFNSAALLASSQRAGGNQSVLWDLKTTEVEKDETSPKTLPGAADQKDKKFSKRMAIVNIGRNVAKKTFRKYPTFIAQRSPHTPSPTSASLTNQQSLASSTQQIPLPISSRRHPQNHSPKQKQHKTHKQFATSSIILSRHSTRRTNKIDWSENAKPGVHIWYDISNTQNYESCYLNDLDALEFHNIKAEDRCKFSSRSLPKKKCMICKLVVHENCIESLQNLVKCRITFRESINKKKSLKESNSNSIGQNLNLHHWLCYRYDEQYFENRCQACSRTFTNRFGLQPNRSIVSCSWCKASYHLKCFVPNQYHLDCNLGEHNQLVVPPSWIVKTSSKNFRSSLINRSHPLRSSRKSHTVSNTENGPQHDSIDDEGKEDALADLSTSPVPLGKALVAAAAVTMSSNYRQPSIRSLSRVFIVRPPNSTSSQNLALKKPLLVLINPKSGGIMGSKLLKKFTWLLNARQVFDLTQNGGPKLPLYLYRNVPNLRLLVGGGDGSVGWVLSVIDQIRFLQSPPSVAVLPLGTGNDLARALNWGGGYTDEPLSKILAKIADARTVKLDRWKISTWPNPDVSVERSNSGMAGVDSSDESVSSIRNDVMNNYFSLGADAHVCLEFHERREANPHKFTSRWFNLLQYAEAGGKDQIKKTWRDLKDFIKLECDNKNYTDVIKSRGYHCLIFLNIPKYSSGTNPWGTMNDVNFQPQAMNDGRLEVIGCYTSTLAKFQLGGNGERICQAKFIKLTTYRNIPMQIDGEPARLGPSVIEIRQKNQALMLEHVKFNTDSPILGYHSNVHKNFQVKCILMEDYEDFRKESRILELKAIYIGAICTHYLTDPLSKFRQTIDMLIKNCANGFFTSKWSFLNGDEFYRVSDDSDECLLDIVSIEEIIYILDENERNTNKTFKKTFTLSDGDLLKYRDEEKSSSTENVFVSNGPGGQSSHTKSERFNSRHDASTMKSSKSYVGIKFAQLKDSSKSLYNSVPSLHKLKK